MRFSKFQNYIIANIGAVFFPIFFSFYFIATIFIFIQIAAKTSFFHINFLEMLEFYLYSIPDLVVYLLPVAFFASSVIALSKLSFDLEIIVAFSLQSTSRQIIAPIIYLASLVMFTSLIFAFIVSPQAKYKIKEFLYKKEATAKVNLRASEFGQKFGDLALFIKEKTPNEIYKDVVVFSTQPTNEIFIKAKEAKLVSNQDLLSLKLKDGQAYRFEQDSLKRIIFEEMSLNKEFVAKKLDFLGILEYWKSMYKSRFQWEIYLNALVSAFGFLSVFLILAIGIYNPRYQKNRSNFFIIASIIGYFYLIDIFGKSMGAFSLLFIPAVWLVLSFLVYKKRLKVY